MNVRAHRYLGAACAMGGRPDRAAESYRHALALSPGHIGGHFLLGRSLLAQGDAQAALAAVEQEAHPGFKLTVLAMVNHALGNTAASDAAVTQLHADWSGEAAYQIAEVHAFRGEIDDGIAWLNKAVGQHDPGISTLRTDPLLTHLHADLRWTELLDRTGERLSRPHSIPSIAFLSVSFRR